MLRGGAGRHVEHLVWLRADAPAPRCDHRVAPAPVLAEGQHLGQKVVARGEPLEQPACEGVRLGARREDPARHVVLPREVGRRAPARRRSASHGRTRGARSGTLDLRGTLHGCVERLLGETPALRSMPTRRWRCPRSTRSRSRRARRRRCSHRSPRRSARSTAPRATSRRSAASPRSGRRCSRPRRLWRRPSERCSSYAYARVGYHRGLDALRHSGSRGSGSFSRAARPTSGSCARSTRALRRRGPARRGRRGGALRAVPSPARPRVAVAHLTAVSGVDQGRADGDFCRAAPCRRAAGRCPTRLECEAAKGRRRSARSTISISPSDTLLTAMPAIASPLPRSPRSRI